LFFKKEDRKGKTNKKVREEIKEMEGERMIKNEKRKEIRNVS
jgi:hypothetical protein